MRALLTWPDKGTPRKHQGNATPAAPRALTRKGIFDRLGLT
jgi:hypothetical protein